MDDFRDSTHTKKSPLFEVSKKQVFFTPADMIRVYDGLRQKSWCYKYYKQLKVAYNLTERRHIPTISQFCEFMDLDEELIRKKLARKL